MKKLLLLFALLFTRCTLQPAFAQSPVVYASPYGDNIIKPQAVPTSLATISSVDSYLKELTITNPTSGAITVSVCDLQGTPICLLPAVGIAANSATILTYPTNAPYWMPGGWTIIGGPGLKYQAAWR